jgi:hypothetical protein
MKHRSFAFLTIAFSIGSMLAAAPSRCEAGIQTLDFSTPTTNDPVPEPASLAIWAIGSLAGLGYYARRRRVSAA